MNLEARCRAVARASRERIAKPAERAAALWPIGGRGGFVRLPAAAGVIIGAVLALGILTGWLSLTVGGIVIVTLLQGVWILLVVGHLISPAGT